MKTRSPVQAYFEADTSKDVEALVRLFAPDGVVGDEGGTHTGYHAIAAWWRDAKAKYQYVLEPLEASEDGDRTQVRARVTGQFPGSPATLTFSFELAGDQIARLEIGA